MIRNLKVIKNNLAAVALAGTMIFTSGCSIEHKEYEPTEASYSTIYMTEYDDINHELYWDEKTPEELADISKDIIALKDVEDDTLYVASYLAVGYEAALKNDTKSEARKNNPEYAKNESFNAGYDLGKVDMYLNKARDEQRAYVSITTGSDNQTTGEANYYPVDELTVISYTGRNAIVRNYNEQQVKNGNYEDLLGQDMTNYIGKDFEATSLQNFALDNYESLPQDAIYMAYNDYRYIAKLTTTNMSQVNANTTSKTR